MDVTTPRDSVPAARAATPAQFRLRCIGGPDKGRLFMVEGAEVTLGRSTGALVDPAAGERHATFWAAAEGLSFRSLDQPIVIDDIGRPEGVLHPGQHFRMGSSLWHVEVKSNNVTNVVESIAGHLSHLASTDKLEGFSLKDMFSDVFRKRSRDEVENYFIVGTSKTTPPLMEVETGWPHPWFFMRVLAFIGIVYFGFSFAMDQFRNANLVPGLIMMGSLAVPLATVVLFFELNTPRNVSFLQVLMLVCWGGVVSLFVSLVGFQMSSFDWLGASSAGIVEEIGKLIAVVAIVRQTKYKYILNGILFGAAVGAGFAAFESAGYAFRALLRTNLDLDVMIDVIHLRAFLTPFGHVAWTAIAAGALWRVKGDQPFRLAMLGDAAFLKAFLIPVVLHMIWNSPVPSPLYSVHLALGAAGWFVVFGLVQQGLKQVREEQALAARAELAIIKSA